jgi:hypothetical protein
MTKEQLMAMGLTAEQAEKVLAAHKTEMEGFVPRARLNEETEKVKGLNAQLAERDKDIAALKVAAGKGSELENKLTELQSKYDTDTKKLNEQLAAAKLDAALDVAIMGAKGRNPKAIKALIDTSKLKLKDDGTVDGLDLAALQKSDPYLFAVEKTDPKGPGYTPPAGGDSPTQPKTLHDAVAQALQNQQQKG